MLATTLLLSASALLPSVSAHIALFTPAMWGFNVTESTDTHAFPGDNRPVVPLMDRTFSQWWFHGLLDFPPHPDDILQLPVGQTSTVELACDKGATSWYATSAGSVSLQGNGNNPCPGYPTTQFHTNGADDLGGCALSVAYKSDVNDVKPDDFVVFSIQHTCVWTRFTTFDIPAAMPPCPNGKCLCTWNWIHKADAGSEQMYQSPFQCNFEGATGTKAVAPGKVPRRCGADPDNGKMNADPSNCTVGAKTPMYWFQKEGNNMFEGTYAPPLYLPLYGFEQGAQNDIFGDGSVTVPATTVQATSAAQATTTKIATAVPVSTSVAAAPVSSSLAAASSSAAAGNPGSGSSGSSSAAASGVGNAGGSPATTVAGTVASSATYVSASASVVASSSSPAAASTHAPLNPSAVPGSAPAGAPTPGVSSVATASSAVAQPSASSAAAAVSSGAAAIIVPSASASASPSPAPSSSSGHSHHHYMHAHAPSVVASSSVSHSHGHAAPTSKPAGTAPAASATASSTKAAICKKRSSGTKKRTLGDLAANKANARSAAKIAVKKQSKAGHARKLRAVRDEGAYML